LEEKAVHSYGAASWALRLHSRACSDVSERGREVEVSRREAWGGVREGGRGRGEDAKGGM
jgi:hypothetical protein